jgi:hypothetical protein
MVASLAGGASVAAAFEAVSSEGATRAPAAGEGATLPRTGANSISHLQLGSVAVIGGIGMLLIARLRRRALRPATITS